eukprot:2900641-Ditylum_brightwellii.AAC.1
MASALMAGLQALGVQSRFLQALAYGPLDCQGLSLPSLRVTQFIDHLHVLGRHDCHLSLTCRLLNSVLQSHQVELGTSCPLWDIPVKPWSVIVTKSWLCST